MPIHVTTSTTQSLSNKTFVDHLSTTGEVYSQSGDSLQWNDVYSTVNANSATTWNYQGTDVKSLTSNWENTYTQFSTQSANNASVYSTVNSNSATWGAGGSGADTEVRALTGNWQSTYTTVQSNSSTWGGGGSFTVEDANTIIGLSMFL